MYVCMYFCSHDFAIVCRTFKLNYKEVMNHVSSDGHGMYTLHTFMMYMQRQQELPQRNGMISDHTHNYYNADPGFRYVCACF